MKAQIIEKDGRPEWAVIPYDDYRALLGLAEDMADIRAADEALMAIEAGDETYPPKLVERLCETANPLPVWREYRQLTPQELAARVGLDAAALGVDADDLAPRTNEGRGGEPMRNDDRPG